ncbi:MAG: BrnA antitoxin family protein [Rhizonema sp. PD38]|nr:BrnA antitoxin family protein [Rhizonema sp. PD38]
MLARLGGQGRKVDEVVFLLKLYKKQYIYIDFYLLPLLSDIPELDEEFFKNAELVERRPRTEAISIRIDSDVLRWFKEHAKTKGYQTLINDVLRTYVEHSKGKQGEALK